MLVSALASALALAAPDAAQEAQTVAPPSSAVEQSQSQGVIRYPPEFFAAAQPTTALDMLLRLPGFNIDTGDSVRGFEGAAGNVLIDGRRPATKTDNLEEILRRIPASQVARIDLIRGGAPGVDMQGKSVLASVIRKDGGGFRGLVALSGRSVYDGRNTVSARVELSGGSAARTWETSFNIGKGIDDGSGEGPGVRTGPSGVVIQRSDIDQEGDTVQTTATAAFSSPLVGGTFKLNGRIFDDNFKFDEVNHIVFPTESRRPSTTTTNWKPNWAPASCATSGARPRWKSSACARTRRSTSSRISRPAPGTPTSPWTARPARQSAAPC